MAQFPVIPNKKCDLCDINDIEWKCIICDELLCDHCKTAHLRSKATKNHKVADLKGADVSSTEQTVENRKCIEHPSEDLQMYCKSCDVPVCLKCITSPLHESHSFELVDVIIDNKRRELLDIGVTSKEKLSKCKQTIHSVSKNKREFSAKISQTIEEVRIRNDELKNNLDKITNDLIQQLQKLEKRNQTAWKGFEYKLQEESGMLQNLVQKIEEEKKKQGIEIVKIVTEINQQINSLKPVDPPTIENPPEFKTKDVTEDLRVLFGNLTNLPTATSAPPLPAKLPIEPKAIRNPEMYKNLIHTFTCENKTRITAAGNDRAWVWSIVYPSISLVTSEGLLLKTVKTVIAPYDAVVIRCGDLAMAIGSKLQKLIEDGKIADLYKAPEGYKIDCVTVTVSGDIIAGLTTNNKKLVSKLVEMTTNGEEIRTIKYDTVDKTRLFDNPCSISCNTNGDIVVVDDVTRVIVIDKHGHKKITYEGQRGGLKKMFSPRCVVTDRYGHIFISDNDNSVVHMLDKDGTFLQCLVTEKSGCNKPEGLSIDTAGRLWVCNKTGSSFMVIRYV